MYSASFIVYGRVVTLSVTEGEGEMSNIMELPQEKSFRRQKNVKANLYNRNKP